ncbi:TonB-dependent siderophore receptor [Bowmanella denitrificans]|uniref:TonB-dependent siderophore receptor n=1 Tax=Bowmanella denitrificans TaxID=366582 RepID=UPI000C9A209B|nr:TonB-dependent siderophore receptor [Bowmanella denitrificans]
MNVKRSSVSLVVLSALFSHTSYANSGQENIEKLNVTGSRSALYDTRDVNAAALGTKDTQLLPISIQSFSDALIANQRAKTLGDVLANDASVQNTAIGTVFDFVSLRGFQLDWTNGLRRDGLALAPFQDVALENIQRLDVIKGPSGLISGVNNPGGTVNYVTKRPTQKQFLEVTGEVRSRNGKYLHLDSGGPLDAEKNWGYRFNAAAEDTGDFSGGDDLKRYFLSAALDWAASDKLFVRFDADFQDKKVVSQPLIGLAQDPNNSDISILPPYVDTSDILLGQPWGRYETQSYNLATRVDYWLTDSWQWVNQFAYSDNNRFTLFPDIYQVDTAGNVLSAAIHVTPDEKYRSYAAVSFLSGEFQTGDIAHNLVAGVSLRDYQSADGRWFELPNPVGNLFNPVHTSRPQYPDYPDATITDTKENSLFITDTLYISDTFYATLGLRHIRYEKLQHAPDSVQETLDNQRFTTPLIGLNYNPSDNLAFYASYSEGAGEGGVAVIGSGAINEGESLGPQESEQLEAGVKFQTQSATYTLAVFEIEKMLEYHNRVSNYFVQDGVQSHRGIELNINGKVSDALSVVSSVTLMDASLDKLVGQPLINGNRPANVPKFQANLFLDYQVQALAGLYAQLGIFHVGERQQNVLNSLSLPAYTRADLGVKYELSALNTIFRLKIENLFDKEYWLSAGAKGVDWGVTPGKGRTWIASMTYSF